MIRYSLRRQPGGRRYSATDRTIARALDAADAPRTLTDTAIEAMQSPDGIRVTADVLFEVESNRFARPTDVRLLVDGIAYAPGSGTLATIVDGFRNPAADRPPTVFPAWVAVPGNDAVVELTWDGTRRVNLVEVHGDPMGGQITAATVFVRDVESGDWVESASLTGEGRLAIPLPELAETTGIRARIDEVAGDVPPSVVEVDPMWVLDVTAQVVTGEVEWSREADPGAAASPVGNYEASVLSLTLDDTSGFWNPATNASLDVGHRVEVAIGVRYRSGAQEWEELLPAGVFYTEPFDTDSEATTVTISAVDKLGRRADVEVSEEVMVGATVEEVVRTLAAKYLDLDETQVYLSPSIAETVIPYAYPSGLLGTYLADLAKATGAVVHMDPYGRLVMARRTDTTDEPVAVFTDDTNLIRFRRPPGYDSTTSIVNLTAAPLSPGPEADLWAMPSGGISIGSGSNYTLVARYESPPAIGGAVTGVVADGAYTITSARFYSDRAEITIRNRETRRLVVADLRVRGTPLIEGTLTARKEHAPSVRRYGPRVIDTEARLIQTAEQLDTIADVLLDAFRSIGDDGVRRLPDVELDALGLLHVATGDRVTLSYPSKGLSGDFAVLSRRLVYENGAILANGMRVRESPSALFAVADVSITDDQHVAGY